MNMELKQHEQHETGCMGALHGKSTVEMFFQGETADNVALD